MIFDKIWKARDLAERIAKQDDDDDETDVTIEDIREWGDDDVIEWLEVGWDFVWDESIQEWQRTRAANII